MHRMPASYEHPGRSRTGARLVLLAVAAAGAAAVALAFAATPVAAKIAAAPASKYYLEVELATNKTKGGKELEEAAMAAIRNEVSERELFVLGAAGDGAPPATDEAARAAWLKSKGLVGLALQVTLEKFVEKSAAGLLTMTLDVRALLVTRPGGWMVVSTHGGSESEGSTRKGALEAVAEGAAGVAVENVHAHLKKKPVDPTKPRPKPKP